MQQLAEAHQASLNLTLPPGKSDGKDLVSHLLTHKCIFIFYGFVPSELRHRSALAGVQQEQKEVYDDGEDAERLS